MNEKNPWLAAILNFLLPGLGFVYVGLDESIALVVGGILYLVVPTAISYIMLPQLYKLLFSPQGIVYSLSESAILAVIAYGVAEIYNEKAHALRKVRYYATNVKKFCNYCGAENPADAIFCRECGKEIK